EEIGEKLYFFRSEQAGETKCLVWAHGGHLYGDGTFNLLSNINLHFLQREHGKSLTSNPWMTMFAGGKPRAETLESFRGPRQVTNYSLGKGVGSHWKGDTISYQQIREKMTAQLRLHNGQWCPHIVIVRRRFRGLGRLITLHELVLRVVK